MSARIDGERFACAQRIVLKGGHWAVARQLMLSFAEPAQPLRFLHLLIAGQSPTCISVLAPELQLSLGFSRRGLERARVPAHVLACFAAKAPAFMAGAALRAASHAGLAGRDAPSDWEDAFAFMRLDAVVSLHARTDAALAEADTAVHAIAKETGVDIIPLTDARALPAPEGEQWVHFGYRDGLTHVGIDARPDAAQRRQHPHAGLHAAGEFLLGHAQDSGANPWLASAGQRVWSRELRSFFHNASFGVLQQIQQEVATFEAFVSAAAAATGLGVDGVKAKLCGRTPHGLPLAAASGAAPEADFDYAQDARGVACPFGSHVRRMNPRGDSLAHARSRPLVRRGMPYGPAWEHPPENKLRGLIGQFFCASIEDQFEHLLGQWADRVPLGSADDGGARDPLIGAHEGSDGGFEIPMAAGRPVVLPGLRPFTRTRGTAYLFYPSLVTLRRIADNEAFADLREDFE